MPEKIEFVLQVLANAVATPLVLVYFITLALTLIGLLFDMRERSIHPTE